jgi:hypothetical protein
LAACRPWTAARGEIGGPEGSLLGIYDLRFTICDLRLAAKWKSRTGSKLVGSAGNAPVVASGLFEDTDFTDRPPDHFPKLVAGVGVAPT